MTTAAGTHPINHHVISPNDRGGAPPQTDNIMRRAIAWFCFSEEPSFLKITYVALAALATLATGHLLGQALLLLSTVTAVTALWALKEISTLMDETPANQNLIMRIQELQRELTFAKMKDLFGGGDSFEQLPVLDIGDREGDTGYIDFIRENELTEDVMRGVDRYNRPFITMKIKNREDQELILVLFPRYTTGTAWTYACDRNFLDARLGDADRAQIRQILNGTHETYSLANA